MGNPQQQPSQTDFGDVPDIDDLLFFADLDGNDVEEAMQWLEDKAPDAARKLGTDGTKNN